MHVGYANRHETNSMSFEPYLICNSFGDGRENFWLTTICIRNHADIYGYVLQVPINFHICYTFCLNCGQKELGCTAKVSTRNTK